MAVDPETGDRQMPWEAAEVELTRLNMTQLGTAR